MYRGIGKGPDSLRGERTHRISCKFPPSPVLRLDPKIPGLPGFNTRSSKTSGNYKRMDEQEKRGYNPKALSTTLPSDCKNYEPVKTELDRYVGSTKSGNLYLCNNFENHESVKEDCSFCCNWVTLNGEDKGYKSSPEKLVKYYASLYKEDSDKFIRFFRKRSYNDKKKILEGILECDFVNEEVIKYLDESWSELVREVGISLV